MTKRLIYDGDIGNIREKFPPGVFPKIRVFPFFGDAGADLEGLHEFTVSVLAKKSTRGTNFFGIVWNTGFLGPSFRLGTS